MMVELKVVLSAGPKVDLTGFLSVGSSGSMMVVQLVGPWAGLKVAWMVELSVEKKAVLMAD